MMSTVLRRARRRLPTGLRKPARRALRVQRALVGRRVVLQSGAFDQEWYEAQTGIRFASIEKACWHYLWVGRQAGNSPHPLFEPAVAQPKAFRSVSVDPLVSNLRGRVSKDSTVHAALPASWAARDRATRLPRWLAWASTATAESVLPVRWAEPDGVTWGEFRPAALDAARRCRRAQELRSAPVLTAKRPQLNPARPAGRSARRPVGPSMPLVSVVMPTWNRGGLLRRAVESVQAQTLTDWELLIVDDGSDDDTLLVLEGLARFEPRLQVIAAPHRGVCRARNLALEAACGRYVAFLDTDNTWTPDFLRQTVAFAEAHTAPWVHAAMQVENADGTRYRAFQGSREQLLHGNYIDLNVLIAEHEVLERIGGFDESLRRAVDYDLILRLSELSPPRLVPMIGAVYRDNAEDVDRISVAEPRAWNYTVSLKHLIDPHEARERLPVPGRVSIVVPVRERPQHVVDLVAGLRATADVDVEIVVVVSGPAIQAARAMQVAAIGSPNVTVIYRPTEFGWAASIDLGAFRAAGEYVVAWRANCLPGDSWWPGLRDALEQPGVAIAQALGVQPDGRISSAGGVFVGNDPFPSPLLANFPIEDAAPLTCSPVPAAYESVIALRSDAFWAVDGIDPILANEFGEVDLSLRVRAAGLGGTVVTNTATVTHSPADRAGFTADPSASVRVLRLRHTAPGGSAAMWQHLDFQQTGRRVSMLSSGRGTAAEQGARPVVRPLVTESPRRLRWALDVAVSRPGSPAWRFGQDLAAALRELGQQVHVDGRKVRNSVHRDFDDVTLVLRGGDVVRPRPGGVAIMWVLSDPESVTEPECRGYDRVLAASSSWAATMTKRWGLQVDPLLQCADATLFRPDDAALARAAAREAATTDGPMDPEVVFVGDSDGFLRPALKGAIDAGLRPTVHGRRWHGLIPDDLIADTELTDDQLRTVFGSASAVLWDHWGDLRAEGFISQRVFEILASGGRLLCDDVVGLREEFGDAVAVFGSDRDLTRLATSWRTRWPGADERLALAERVRTEHSFAARAQALVDTALRLADTDGGKELTARPGHPERPPRPDSLPST